MPTAAKLIAGIFLAFIAALVAFIYQLDYPNSTFAPSFYWVSALIGFSVGWYTLGQNPHFGGWNSVVVGLRSVVILAIVASILWGLYHVFAGMGDHAYYQPMQVPITWIRVSIAYFTSSLRVDIWSVMFLFGALAGRVTGIVNWHWR
jgi:hypothetical protein